ncbi:unnamed protein product [Linum trigynum]|uniref:Thiol-disulfide oxidoreductase DCC n=1 Tax=Linum trigynum TaxID=586398 RepID=A0AAV2G733_9ROSI
MAMAMKMKTAATTACNSLARKSKYVQKPASLPTPHILRAAFHRSSVSGGLVDGFPSQSVFQAAGRGGGLRAVHRATPTMEPVTSNEKGRGETDTSPENWKIKMLYDGDCPLCMREVDMLRERNKSYGTIKFVDISSDDYSAEDNQGLDYETAMGRIHAIMADGTVVTDVEAFRRLYEQVGLGWVYAITKFEPIGKLADAVYAFWAKYRLQVTGRPPLEQVLEARKKKGEVCKTSDACKL